MSLFGRWDSWRMTSTLLIAWEPDPFLGLTLRCLVTGGVQEVPLLWVFSLSAGRGDELFDFSWRGNLLFIFCIPGREFCLHVYQHLGQEKEKVFYFWGVFFKGVVFFSFETVKRLLICVKRQWTFWVTCILKCSEIPFFRLVWCNGKKWESE